METAIAYIIVFLAFGYSIFSIIKRVISKNDNCSSCNSGCSNCHCNNEDKKQIKPYKK
ncbi:MAG: hypothetical protein CSA15_06340 [Candidatus Delongbacteria bacterium]|nr:MAG: hypothetical protein CSA15_06340 [Candidatus Delongbacteria bacterium]